MFNPEKKYFESLDINEAWKHAELVLRKEAIKPEKFKNVYPVKDIENDTKLVARMEEKFRAGMNPEQFETHKLATVFEAVVHEHAELSEWFGGNAITKKTSRFDDIQNGIDDVVEFQPEDESESAQHLGLAIDVTLSQDKEKALERIKREIDSGELAHIKYFDPTSLENPGLRNLPRVVIGAEAKTIKALADLWLEKQNRELGMHPIQFQILEEILIQLETFADYARQKNKPNLVAVYEKTYALLQKIYAEKQTMLPDEGNRDYVFQAIKDAMRIFV